MSLSPKLRRKLEGLARLCDAPEGSGFRALAEASGLDPKTDFRGLDLSGVDLRDQDLRHIDFTDANFGGAFVAGGQFNATARLETAADAPIRQLTENEVRDMVLRGETPDPRACETIVRINLSGTKIADLNPLKTLANLRLLDLYRTKVANLGPLKTLANLQRLHLEGTPVADLAPLKHLANLKTLYLSSTQVSDLTPLRDLKNLEHLFLNETQVADLTPVRHVKSIYGATPEAYATIGRDAEGNPVED